MEDGIYLDPIRTFPPVPPAPPPTPAPTLPPTISSAPSEAPVPTAPPSAVTFYALGDVPYSDMEACLLPFELDKMDPNARFLIHLGDVRDGKPDPVTGNATECPESLFQELSTIFESSDLTPFFIPGDNAWLDCANPGEAYEYWEQYLFSYNERTDLTWPTFPVTVNRWDTFPTGVTRTSRRSEFFSFLIDKVLFVGLSLPGSGRNEDNEWTPRDGLIQDNIQWTSENFDEHLGQMEAIVLFGHASSSLNEGFFDALATLLSGADFSEVPTLFLEDNHFLNVDENFLGLSNLLRIEQDDTVTPLKISVDTSATGISNVFQLGQGCLCSTGHRPTRLISYVDSHPCGGQCTEGAAGCQGENRCSPEGAACDP